MAASDAKTIAIKNQAYRISFPIWDADGDLVTAAATLDSEVSKDGGTFADCTNEATEIATSSGVYFLDLTATEMNADTVAVIVKTGTAGAKTSVLVIYPAARGINDLAFPNVSGRGMDIDAAGGAEVGSFQTGAITAAAFTAGAIDAAAIATDAIGSAEFAQAAADKVWSAATRTLTAFNTALAVSIWDVLESAIVTASSIGVKVKTNLDALISSRAPESGGNVAAIKAKTDQLTFTIANKVDASIQAAADFAQAAADKVWASATRTLTALGTALAVSVWDVLETAISTASSIGLKLKTNLDVVLSTRAPEAGGNLAAIKAKTDLLPEGIRKNTALANFEFLMVDATDFATPETGLTVTGTVSIDGGAFVALTNAVTEVANGIYKINLAAADLNGDVVTLRFTGTGAAARLITIKTSP